MYENLTVFISSVTPDFISCTILGLEDSVAFSIRSTLESLGVSSQVVSGYRAALNLIQGSEQIKLLIVDLDRFEGDIQQFLKQAQEISPELRFILTTIDSARWQAEEGESIE